MPIKYDATGSGQSADTVTDPQKLFQALPAKAKKYAYLRDVQGDVLGKWYVSTKERDAVIKMNTGGGKTTVGLLLLWDAEYALTRLLRGNLYGFPSTKSTVRSGSRSSFFASYKAAIRAVKKDCEPNIGPGTGGSRGTD
jgi:hypothetical protein